MAEIRIEEKKNNNWLPWLLGVLGLLLLGWLAVDVFDKDGEPELLTADEVDFPDLHANDDRIDDDVYNAKVQDEANAQNVNYTNSTNQFSAYLTTIENFEKGEMSLDHDHSHEAITALANSLEAMTDDLGIKDDADIMEKTQTMKQKADMITNDWKSTNHADQIRQAAICASEVISEIQRKKFPNLGSEVNSVKSAAKNIDPAVLTLDQKEAVKGFFRAAATSIEAMQDDLS
jgi:hypothetical protein